MLGLGGTVKVVGCGRFGGFRQKLAEGERRLWRMRG